jgi:predicted dehydrogenase
MMETYRVAFIGAGGIARAHAFGLAALPFYYDNAPAIVRKTVTSATPESRTRFAERFGFNDAIALDDLWSEKDIDTIFILGPNDSHYPHFEHALKMDSVRHIYLEKPICASRDEELAISRLIKTLPQGKKIQTGFQFLQMANVRLAMRLWREIDFGKPIHFFARYLHSGYLGTEYREKRRSRLKIAPAGGAMADLGSHPLSFLAAFLGDGLDVIAAEKSGDFEDVPPGSDLCSTALLRESKSGAQGSVTASRISAGSGDWLELEIMCTKCAFRVSTKNPDILEFYPGGNAGEWQTIHCGSDYLPATKFPSLSMPSGWLRSMIHAHYLFFGGEDEHAYVPDITHGLTVQRLVRQTAEHFG